jgi:peptidoglycan/xylan/chitin deacetylase (PgdA/CDA1 family)
LIPRISLSFDNGPDPEVTPYVLERLAARGIRATFFMLGRKLEEPHGPALARQVLAGGHHIGNHTYSHTTPLGRLTAQEALAEFDATARAIARVGETRRLFRPYGGGGRQGPHLLQRAIVERMTAEGYTCVLWNCVPGDFRDPEGWLARAIAGVEAQNWPLVVLHDISLAAMQRLDPFLDYLEERDYEFRQDFPPQCTPVVDGRIMQDLRGISS